MRSLSFSTAFVFALLVAGCGSGSKCDPICVDPGRPDSSADQATDQAAAETSAPDVDVVDAPDAPGVQPDSNDFDGLSLDATDAGCPADAAFDCATQGFGHNCSDTLVTAVCIAGKWQCPAGGVPFSQCLCAGRPAGAGCTYTPDCVLTCSDAGIDGSHDGSTDTSIDSAGQ